jgi:hypothetical protein
VASWRGAGDGAKGWTRRSGIDAMSFTEVMDHVVDVVDLGLDGVDQAPVLTG